MLYVYGCEERDHPRVEARHGMKENPTVTCGVCGKVMRRIPQPVRWGYAPGDVWAEHVDREFGRWRQKEKRKRALRS